MPRLQWGAVGERFFEAGINRGVLYPKDVDGVAWDGLLSVNETSVGNEVAPYYLDGVRYHNRVALSEYAASITAMTYPEEFEACEGTATEEEGLTVHNQKPLEFGLSYRTLIGNDVAGQDFAYRIHLIYNALATPTSKDFSSLSEALTPTTFNWNVVTRPNAVLGFRPTAHYSLDSRRLARPVIRFVEDILYGTESSPARLPSPTELRLLLATQADILTVIDNGDGTYMISGPDEMVRLVSETIFQVDSPSVTMINATTFEISSL